MLHTNQQQRTHENVAHRLCQLNRLHQIEDIHRTFNNQSVFTNQRLIFHCQIYQRENKRPDNWRRGYQDQNFSRLHRSNRNDAAAPTLLLRLAARRAMARAQPAIRATPTIIPIMTPDMNPISSVLFSTRQEREGTGEEENDLESKCGNYIRKFLDQIADDCLSKLFITANAAFGTDFFACY